MEKKKKGRWIIWVVCSVLFALLALGIYMVASGRLIRVYGTVLHVEKLYFDYNEEHTCSLNNPYYKQIVSAIKELEEQETVAPPHDTWDPEFTIHAYDGVRCEVFHGCTDYGVPQVIGYVDDMNYSALGVRIFKNGLFTSYFYNSELDGVSEVWSLINKAREWEE